MMVGRQQSETADLKLNQFLPYLMVSVSNKLSLALSRIYAQDHELSIAEWRIMANLHEHGALTSKELSGFTQLDKVAISRALKSLEEKSWIKRKVHDADQRAFFVALNARGKAVMGQMIPKILRWERQLLGQLESEQYGNLLEAIAYLNRRLSELEEESGE